VTGFDEGPVEEARVEAAQMEWERNKRVITTQTLGITTAVDEIRKVLKRIDIDVRDERELLRYVELIADCAYELTSENWLKSPKAMAEKRRQDALAEKTQ
jgi:hypothetical protein